MPKQPSAPRLTWAYPVLVAVVAACGGPGPEGGLREARSNRALAALAIPDAAGNGVNVKLVCNSQVGGTCWGSGDLNTIGKTVQALNKTPAGAMPNVLSWVSGHAVDWTDGDGTTVGLFNLNTSFKGVVVPNQVVHWAPWSFSGYVAIPAAGAPTTKTFAVGSDDGFRLAISNGTQILTYTQDAPRSFAYGGKTDSVSGQEPPNLPVLQVTFPAAGGLFPFELVYYEEGGNSGLELAWADGAKAAVPTAQAMNGFALVPAASLYTPDVRASLWADNTTSAGGNVASGTVLRYTASLSNVGPVAAAGLTFAVTLPSSQFSSVTPPAGCAVAGSYTITCAGLAVAAGASTNVSFLATVAALGAGTNLDVQGVVKGFATAPELAAAQGDTVGMYVLTDDAAAGPPLSTTDTGNAPLVELPTGLTDDDLTRVTLGAAVVQPPTITGPTGVQSSLWAQTVTGTSSYVAGALIRVTATGPGGLVVTCLATVVAGGGWSCAGMALRDGSWSLVAAITNGAGYNGTPSAPFALTLSAPTLAPSLTAPADGALLVSGTIVLSGTSPEAPGTLVRAAASAGATTTACDATVQAGGTWACAVTLGDGTWTWSAAALEVAGVEGPWAGKRTLYTSAAGLVAPTLAQTKTPGNQASPVLSGTADAGEVAAGLKLVVREGGTVVCEVGPLASTSWSCTPAAPLGEGWHTLVAVVFDGAGNVSPASANDTFLIDLQAPAAPVVTSSAGPLRTNLPAIAGTGEDGATVAVRNAAGTTLCTALVSGTSWTCTPTAALPEGVNTLSITQADAAGNVSPVTIFALAIDTVAPAVVLGTIAPRNSSTPSVSGTAEAGAALAVKDETGRTVCAGFQVPAGGAWSCTSLALADGSHTLTATATDGAGNTAQSALSVIIDTQAPAAPTVAPVASPTANVRPAFSGSAEAGSTVTVTEGATVLCSATAAAGTGAWACTSAVDLTGAPQQHTVSATATDAAQNTGPASNAVSFVVDTRTPATPTLDLIESPRNVPVTTFTGSAQPGAQVAVKDAAGQVLCTSQVGAGGLWSCSATLPEGPTTVAAVSSFNTGTVSAPSAPQTVVVDTQAPPAPTLDPLAPTNALRPVLSGGGEAGALVSVSAGGEVLCTAVVDAGGRWTCTPTRDLGAGSTQLTLTQTDAAGNTSPATLATIVIDRTAPSIALTQPPAISNSHAQVVSGLTEAGVVVVVKDAAGTPLCTVTAAADGTWSCALTLPEGATTLTATATDAAGNSSTSLPATWLIDTVPPAAPLLDAPKSPTADTTPTFSGTAEAGALVTVTEGGTVLCTATAQADGAWSCDSTVLLTGAPQTHTVSVFATDRAGNTSTTGTQASVVIDTHVPGTPAIDPLPAIVPTATVDVSGHADPGTTVAVTSGGQTRCTTVVRPDGTWSCTATLPEGASTLVATATTPAGVTGAGSPGVTVTVDSTGPAAPTLDAVSSPTANTTPVFTGTAEPFVTVVVAEGGTALCTATTRGDGTWSCTSSALAGLPTTHVVSAQATDGLGRTSPASAPRTFVVDLRQALAPVLDALASPAAKNRLTVSGSSQPGTTVTVVDQDGNVLCTAAADAAGHFACDVTLPDGWSTLTATASFGNGLVSPVSNAITLEVVTHAPPPPTLDPVATLPGAAPNTTSLTQPTLTGTGIPGATVTVTSGGQTVCTATVRPDGTWSCQSMLVFPGVPPAVVLVSATQTGQSGVTSAATTGSFTVDARSPGAPVITPLSSPTNEHRPTLTGTGAEGCTVTVTDAQGPSVCTATVDASGAWSCQPAAALADGDYTFTAAQTTPAGKTSPASAPVSVTIGALDAPTLDQPASPTADRSPTLTGSAPPGKPVTVKAGSTVICAAAANATGRWTCDADPPLPDGTYRLQAFAPGAGGLPAGSSIRPLLVDGTAPAAPTLSAGETPTTNTSPTLSGTAEAASSVTITDEHAAVLCVVTAAASGAFACQPASPLSLGTHTFTASATDLAGNTGPASNPATVRVIPAAESVTVAILDPSDGAELELSPATVRGVATPGSEVTVTVDGLAPASVAAGPEGTWSVDVTPVNNWGDHTVVAEAVSRSGLHSEQARSRFTVLSPQVVRGGCASGGVPVAWLGLLVLLLAWPRRRASRAPARACLRVRSSRAGRARLLPLGLAAGLCATAARAQTTPAVPDINLRLFQPATGGDGYLATSGARPPIDGEGLLELRLWADDAVSPLVVSSADGTRRSALIDNRLVGWLSVQAHLNGPLSLAVQLPITLQQSGSLASLRSASGTPSLSGGLGDLRLVPRLSILRQETFGFDLAGEASLTLPTASGQSMTGDGRWSAGFLGSIGRRFDVGAGDAALDLLGNLFVDLRPPRQLQDVKVGNETGARLALGLLPGAASRWIPNRLFLEAEARTWLRAGFAAGSTPAEWRLGSSWCLANGFAVDAGGGTALGNGIGSPVARFVFSVGYSPSACRQGARAVVQPLVPPPPPPPRPFLHVVEEPKPPAAPTPPEKPADRDGDGVADASDRCPDAAGPASTQGCPELPEAPLVAAVLPPPLPPPLLLPLPALPAEPVVVDSDHDGVPDAQDNCPHEAGPASNQGCPAQVKQLVALHGDKVKILDKVAFATGKALLERRSDHLLDQVAAVLGAHPELALVEVQGHTDNAGNEKKNRALSQARAEAVTAYLVAHGVAPERLRAKGFGSDVPLVPNNSKRNKDKNRRVEFVVVEARARLVEQVLPAATAGQTSERASTPER